MDLLEFMMGLDIQHYSVLKNMMLFTIGSFMSKKCYCICISHNYASIKINSYDALPIEKILTLHVIILIKSVFDKDQNHYCYNIFSQKCSYK